MKAFLFRSEDEKGEFLQILMEDGELAGKVRGETTSLPDSPGFIQFAISHASKKAYDKDGEKAVVEVVGEAENESFEAALLRMEKRYSDEKELSSGYENESS